MIRVCVLGLWHLGCVTAACVADADYLTVGIDSDSSVIAGLKSGHAPLSEPGLDDLIQRGVERSRLAFTSDLSAVESCDLVWVTIDTPVDDNDVADPGFVFSAIESVFPYLKDEAVLLISSQLPVGSTRALAKALREQYPRKNCHFAYSPENLRLGKAIEIFKNAERIVVGCENEKVRKLLQPILDNFTPQVMWLSFESSEMVKHGVNAFLATCITFTNELASICEHVGADAAEVERAMLLEPRIGARAYIKPGAAFSGGTLARDIVFLRTIAHQEGLVIPLINSVIPSNEAHKHWPVRRMIERLGSLSGRTVAVLGLAYKPGTNTLRRSAAIEICRELSDHGAKVCAFDPAIHCLPEEFEAFVTVKASAKAALTGADAAIVATDWPEFRSIELESWLEAMPTPVICDPNGFLAKIFYGVPKLTYMRVGGP